jgi:NADH-quinone oxidoreductase subunit L
MYVTQPALAESFAANVKGLYTLVYNKYFVDEIYAAAVVDPLVDGSREVLWKDVDVKLIDGAANGVAARARNVGGVLRLIQSGNIRSYATWVLLGSVVLIVAMGIAEGLR